MALMDTVSQHNTAEYGSTDAFLAQPHIKALLQQIHSGFGAQQSAANQQLKAEMSKAGITIKDGKMIGRDGRVSVDPNTALTAAMIMGGATLGAFALPALAGSAPVAGPGGGASVATGGTSAAATGTSAAATGTTVGSKVLGGLKKAAPLLSDVSGVASGISAGRAQGRALEGQQDLQAATGKANAYDDAKHEALLAALLQGTQDSQITAPAGIPMGTVTGGLRPSSFAGKEDLGKLLAENAKTRLANPPDTDFDSLGGKPNALDTGLNVLGMAGGLLGAAAPFLGSPKLPDAPNIAPLQPGALSAPTQRGGPMAGVSFGPPLPDFQNPLLSDPRYRVKRSGGVQF